MRRAVHLLTGLALATGLTALAAPAGAAPATRGPEIIKSTVNEIGCMFGMTGGGVEFTTSYRVGVDEPIAGANVETDAGVTGHGQGPLVWGPALSSTIALTTPDGAPAGTFTIKATLTTGDTTSETVDEWDGNLHTTGTVTTTEYQVSVSSATLTGRTLRIGDNCTASTVVFDLQNNNPKYHRTSLIEFESEPCTLGGLEPSQIWIRGDVKEPRFTVVVHRGATLFRGMGELTRRGAKGRGTTELINRTTEEVEGTVKVSTRFTRLGAGVKHRFVEGDTTTVVKRVPYSMTITVRTSAGEVGKVTCATEKVGTWTSTKRY